MCKYNDITRWRDKSFYYQFQISPKTMIRTKYSVSSRSSICCQLFIRQYSYSIFVFYIRFLCLSLFSCLFVKHRLFVKIKIRHRGWNIPAAGNALINLFLVLYSWYNRVKFSVCLLIWKRNMSMQGCEMLMSQFWYRYLLNDCVETYVSKISNLINAKYHEYCTRILFIILIYIVYTVYRTLAEICFIY